MQNTNNTAYPNDIGNFASAEQLSKDTIKNFLQNLWIPDKNYTFPCFFDSNKNERRFQNSWLETFLWLSYSAVYVKDGAFCIYLFI